MELYLVEFDAMNEYTYAEDDYGYHSILGVYDSIQTAKEHIVNICSCLEQKASAAGYETNTAIVDDTHIDFGLVGAMSWDISGIRFEINKIELGKDIYSGDNFEGFEYLNEKEG